MASPDTNDNPGGMAGLEALGGMAAKVDGDNPSAEQQQATQTAAQKAVDAEKGAREWGMLMFTIGGFACMIAPELRDLYSQERCLDWGFQANAVCEKYGWNGVSAMPELALIGATAGFAVPTYLVVSAKIAEAKDGNGPSGWLAKIGLWWRTRKARAAVMTPASSGTANGVQQ